MRVLGSVVALDHCIDQRVVDSDRCPREHEFLGCRIHRSRGRVVGKSFSERLCPPRSSCCWRLNCERGLIGSHRRAHLIFRALGRGYGLWYRVFHRMWSRAFVTPSGRFCDLDGRSSTFVGIIRADDGRKFPIWIGPEFDRITGRSTARRERTSKGWLTDQRNRSSNRCFNRHRSGRRFDALTPRRIDQFTCAKGRGLETGFRWRRSGMVDGRSHAGSLPPRAFRFFDQLTGRFNSCLKFGVGIRRGLALTRFFAVAKLLSRARHLGSTPRAGPWNNGAGRFAISVGSRIGKAHTRSTTS